ncbi:MAG: hypothetical protein GX153_10945 [Clostridiaceae bacterium]|nr:hypothetical protein [Clostridiaceae bacterium]
MVGAAVVVGVTLEQPANSAMDTTISTARNKALVFI